MPLRCLGDNPMIHKHFQAFAQTLAACIFCNIEANSNGKTRNI